MLPAEYRDAPAFSFGDTPEMADSGLADVISRKQVATCGAFDVLNGPDRFMPFEGGLEIVLDGRRNPGCAIRTSKIVIRSFDEIDDEFARMEACTDLAEWRTIHEAYFRRLGCYAPAMKLVCQYFDVVETFDKETRQ